MLGLLTKRLEDLTDDEILGAVRVAGIDINGLDPSLRAAGLALLKGQDIHKVSDLIQSPVAIAQLKSLFDRQKPVQEDGYVLKCPHCQNFFIEEFACRKS